MWPHRRQPIRLPHPWDSPGKNTGVGCHFLFQCIKVKSESEITQSCPTLSDPMDCSLPGSSTHGIFQARVLEWGAIAFSVVEAHLCPIHWRFFKIRKGYCILPNVCSAYIEMIIWISSSILLMQCFTFTDFYMLNHPCIPGMNHSWSWCTILLIVLLN